MIATAYQSRLDRIPDDDEPEIGTLRHYEAEMRKVHGRAPSLGEIVAAAFEASTCHDDLRRNQICGALERTMSGMSGSAGGFLIPVGMAEDVFDRARQTDGPWRRCRWWPVRTREWFWPVATEQSRAQDQRYGGVASQWGMGEITPVPVADAKLDCVKFVANRLIVRTLVSRDIWSDAESLHRWLAYVAVAEFRNAIEEAMILGPGTAMNTIVCPQGVINAPSTVAVAKDSGQTAGTVSVGNLMAQWAAIAPGNKQTACWHANNATIAAIDKLCGSGQFPPNLYFPRGYMGNQHATIFGADLIPSEYCPNLGQKGDVICVDWNDYILTYLKMDPANSPLSFAVDVPADSGHRGLVGMPPDSTEMRLSEDKYFDQDILACNFKYRGDGRFTWTGTSKDAQGNVIGPAAVVAAR
jgi:HK97 family phage major capsid protein